MHKPINCFPGYEYIPPEPGEKYGHNMYRGVDLGFGGYVYAEPGMYTDVALLDVSNMHGASAIALNALGDYTQRFAEIRQIRTYIKHREFDKVKTMFDGKLAKYMEDETVADQLSNALKTAVNSVYGLTSASFDNPARDPRNVNNIVALRGALFMKTLQDEVVAQGFKVAHIKTDSIKIPNATPEIIQFCMDFAKKYDYEFEHEATYAKMCLVNDAVYIAKYDSYGQRNKGGKHAGEWTATGAQFAVPYVFKTCFSHEPIIFSDMCETKSVQSGALYLDFNETLSDSSYYDKALKKLVKVGSVPTKSEQKLIDELKTEFNLPGNASNQLIQSRLDEKIATCHDYQFVGRVGQFTPVLPGYGGGVLLRSKDSKYSAVTGTKKADGTPYRWLESETMTDEDKEHIDKSYYRALVDDARSSIEQYGDYEWFVSDGATPSPDFMNKPE